MSGIYIVKKSITDFDTDAIVNAANCGLWEGGGVCGAIFRAAGAADLTQACREIGHCDEGSAVITPGYKLKAKYVIHAVGPKWVDGKHGEPQRLYDAYKSSLELAMSHGLHSITFPLISAGIFGYPVEAAWRKAIRAAKGFFKHYPDYEMDVYFAVIDDDVKAIGETALILLEEEYNPQPPAVKMNVISEGAGGRSTHEERIAVFQDTIYWCDNNPDLKKSIDKAKKATQIFYEDSYPPFDASIERPERITVTSERSFEAAVRLSKEKPGSKIAVLNFANAFRPGGGVKKGASAQEECLCRTSTLYPLLARNSMREFYEYHDKKGTAKSSDSLIYIEGVVICKTDVELPQRMPKDEWVSVDVITMAAPDLRQSSNQYAPLVGGEVYMNDAELFGYHVKRAIHMLTVAAFKGADTLVLGAFGCGAFRNNPEVVARAYKTALNEFPKVFDRVVFAVICRPGEVSRNYEVFKREFTKE